MVKLISDWTNVESVPERYILPPDVRPGKLDFPTFNDVPVIDLGKSERNEAIQRMLQACKDYGIFQVINHGVSEELMDETMNVFEEFFKLPGDYKEKFYSQDMNKPCRIYSSTLAYETEEFHYWRDNFTHRCHPLEEHIQSWPEKPPDYRRVVSEYSVETRKLLSRILEMISEGLKVTKGYFEGGLSSSHLLSVNYHIPCPDPTLTLGMPVHTDPNLITLLHQCRVPGFQFLRDGVWTTIAPLPHAFTVVTGLTLKAISNDEFKSPVHRVVTNSKKTRINIGVFLAPSQQTLIEPSTAEIYSSNNPTVYRAFTYQEFFNVFVANQCDALKYFKINNNNLNN